MYKVRENHGVLATPWGTWMEGESFIPTPELPRDKLKKWLETGVIVMDEDGPDVEELLEEVDVLTAMTRKELLAVIVSNRPLLATVRPRSSWSEDAIRQAIRDLAPDLSVLSVPVPDETSSL